jgi:hypothetical protein
MTACDFKKILGLAVSPGGDYFDFEKAGNATPP